MPRVENARNRKRKKQECSSSADELINYVKFVIYLNLWQFQYYCSSIGGTIMLNLINRHQ